MGGFENESTGIGPAPKEAGQLPGHGGRPESLQKFDGVERGPKLMHSPFWLGDKKRVTVVHPLGGCPIGADSSTGAIDADGRVYNGDSPAGSKDVHNGLYVVDAAAIPGALGVNPTYTIVTHAVRCMDKIG